MAERVPLVFAPGWRSSYQAHHPAYNGSHNRVMYAFGRAGFEPHFYQPNWRQPDPREWADGMAKYAKSVAEDGRIVLAGFSLGALMAVLAADEVRPSGVIACSLSPWFGPESVRRSHLFPDSEMHEMPEPLKSSFSELQLPKLDCPVQLYVGSGELYTMHMMRDTALAQWPQAETITSPSGHNVYDESYLNAISRNAGRLVSQGMF